MNGNSPDDMSSTYPPSTLRSTGPAATDWLNAFREHEPWLRRVLWNRLGDKTIVDDALQEVGLAASRADLRPADLTKFPAWLYRVAVKQAYLTRRKLGRWRNALSTVQREAAQPHALADEQNPLRWLLVRERRESIHAALQGLSELDREILMLKYSENWTYQQLADRLGVSINTVEHRLLKAKKTLRKLLSEHHVEELT